MKSPIFAEVLLASVACSVHPFIALLMIPPPLQARRLRKVIHVGIARADMERRTGPCCGEGEGCQRLDYHAVVV